MGWYAFLGFAWVVALMAGVLGAEHTPTLGALFAVGFMVRKLLDTFWPLPPCDGTVSIHLNDDPKEATDPAAAATGTRILPPQPTARRRPVSYRTAGGCAVR